MPEEWGPFLTLDAILGTLFVLFLAVYLWWQGHISWLIIEGKKLPPWLANWLDEPDLPISELVKETKSYHIYLGKGLGWIINLLWAWIWLFIYPGGDVSPYEPVIDNVALLHIGAVIFELSMFLIITNLIRLVTQTKD